MAEIARRPLTAVITGSECTGKTTLARELAAHHGATCSPEFVRGYLDRKAAPLDATDVEAIARGQIAVEDEARAGARRLVVKDTDLISTVVYARHYYGGCPVWIERAARERLADLYLLLFPDIPWVADGQRDRPDTREAMHALFTTTLAAFGALVVDVRGTRAERWARSIRALDTLLRTA